jgi:hypothetical protein
VRTALLVRVLGQGRGQGALEGGPPHMKNCLRTFRKRVGREGPGRTGRRAAAHEELPAYVSQKSRAGGTWAHWKESRSHVRQLSPEFRRQGYTQRGGGTAPRQKMPNLEGPYWVGVRPDSGTVA